MKGNPLDFSFSGLKTAVLRWTQARDLTEEIAARRKLLASNPRPSVDEWLSRNPANYARHAGQLSGTVIEELLRRAQASAEEIGAAIGDHLRRRRLQRRTARRCPPREAAVLRSTFRRRALSTDNAVMIAAAAFPKLRRKEFAKLDAPAEPNLVLA